ncbi:MAG TPA: YciI family protein [Polyangiales bacterium]|nr:YciI family protein [Polyangiales bacterium]
MSEFLFLYRGDERTTWSPAEMQERMQRWVVWMNDLRERGHLKDRGHPVERETGKVVAGKDKTVTDGPYPEKDIIGGYSLIEARDLEHAAELSKGCPILSFNGKVEVRALIKMDG